MAKKRDYRAEYARRNELARERGYKNYHQQRRAIETGRSPAIQPTRVRNKSTHDAQQRYKILGGKSVKDYRIEAAAAWSERNARTKRLVFDPVRARDDEDYLSAYNAATVLQIAPDGEDESTLVPSDDLRHLLVDVLHVMTDDEYENRYGELV